MLLRADPFYIDREKNAILAKAYKRLNRLVRPAAGPAIAQVVAAVQHDDAVKPKAVRPLALPKLALPGQFRSLEDLDAAVEDYEQSLVMSQEVLRLVKE